MSKTTFGPKFLAEVGHDPDKWVSALRTRLGTDPATDEVLRDFFEAALSVPERAQTALQRIERWFGEFPETGKFWDAANTETMSYAACFGSNGERDFMRAVARDALATLSCHDNDDDRVVGEVLIDGAWTKLHDPHAFNGYVADGYQTRARPRDQPGALAERIRQSITDGTFSVRCANSALSDSKAALADATSKEPRP